LGLNAQVKLMGSRPQHELPDWYRAANVFVLPSRSEGVPGVLLEAVACGTQFVATRVGGTPEVAHFGVGTLVPPANATALAKAIAWQLRQVPTSDGSLAPIRSHEDSAAGLGECLQHAIKRYHSGGLAEVNLAPVGGAA